MGWTAIPFVVTDLIETEMSCMKYGAELFMKGQSNTFPCLIVTCGSCSYMCRTWAFHTAWLISWYRLDHIRKIVVCMMSGFDMIQLVNSQTFAKWSDSRYWSYHNTCSSKRRTPFAKVKVIYFISWSSISFYSSKSDILCSNVCLYGCMRNILACVH